MPRILPYGHDELRALIGDLPRSAPCMNPRCRRRCTYRRERSGRQRAYCSDRCRMATRHERLKWQRALDRLVETLDRSARPASDDDLEQLANHVKWLLLRYGGAEDYTPEPPAIPLELAMANLSDAPRTTELEETRSAYQARVRAFRRGRRRV